MRASLISLLVFLAAPGFLNAQTKTAREEARLFGPVRSVIEAEAPSSRASRVLVQSLVFDEKGNTTQEVLYNRDGSLKWKFGWDHVYDTEGREVKTYYYNDKGVLTNTGVSIYDDKGRPIQTTQINPNGSINHIRAFSYDDKGTKVHETHRNENGSLRNSITRSYDANGQLTEEVFLGGDGAFHHRNVLTYDNHGNETGWTLFKSDGTVVQVFRMTLGYDERGNVKEAINYRGDNSVIKENFTYEFDDRGNWVKRIIAREITREGGPQVESEVTYRTITYF